MAEPTSTAPDLDSTLSRGFPRGLATTHEPNGNAAAIHLGFMRSGEAAREAPASGGASPYRAGVNGQVSKPSRLTPESWRSKAGRLA